ncbi:MAG: hypothetical protein K5770_01435 [Lachnospiraceae bacterium]|nr:hypothetical protein [Lachnospiraceae bacterium]
MRYYRIVNGVIRLYGITYQEYDIHEGLKYRCFRWNPGYRYWYAQETPGRVAFVQSLGATYNGGTTGGRGTAAVTATARSRRGNPVVVVPSNRGAANTQTAVQGNRPAGGDQTASQSNRATVNGQPARENHAPENDIPADDPETFIREYEENYNNPESGTRSELLEFLHKRKHICWYPSAGIDFAAPLLLSKWAYTSYKFVESADKQVIIPDCFICTDNLQGDANKAKECIDKLKDYANPRGWRAISKLDSSTGSLLNGLDRGKVIDPGIRYSIKTDEPVRYDTGCGFAYRMRLNIEVSRSSAVDKWEKDLLYVVADNREFYDQVLFRPDGNEEEDVSVETVVIKDPEIRTAPKSEWKYEQMFRDIKAKYLVAQESFMKNFNETILANDFEELYRIEKIWDANDPMICYKKRRYKA